METPDAVDALALRLVPGVGDRAFRCLRDHYGSATAALASPVGEWREALGGRIRPDLPSVARPDRDRAKKILEDSASLGSWALVYGSEGYPGLLGAIYDPPALLFGKGAIEAATRGAVAVVGSRRATRHGLAAAELLAGELAGEGLTVVSGLAEGIDTQAHQGCLKAGGHTVAVLGSGLDNLYPRSNLKLSERIIENGGAVITEHIPGTAPEPHHFPRRNRIISGLSHGVVIVEAAQKSGSLITAALALEQGREVFAMPGPARSPAAQGVNNLLRQGAALAETGQDVLSGLGLSPLGSPRRGKAPPASEGAEGEAARMLALLTTEPVDVDTLAALAGMGPSSASAALIELALTGLALNWPGNRYSLPVT